MATCSGFNPRRWPGGDFRIRAMAYTLSPRGRGKVRRASHVRSIPARAGKPSWEQYLSAPKQVYPREGGEITLWLGLTAFGKGLSPRGRGNR